MKSFFARLISMHPLALIAGACLIALTIPSYRLLDAERANVGAVPRTVDKQLTAQGEETREFVGKWLTDNLMPPVNKMVTTVNQLPTMARDLIAVELLRPANAQLSAALTEYGATRSLVEKRSGEALTEIHELSGKLSPVLQNAALLEAAYAALPDRLGAELQPAWLSIQPEITCRTLQGDGYGGCMRSRINGLLGEGLRVGGVFTQHFPQLADNFTGISTDIHSMTNAADHRWFHPPPRTKKQKVWDGFQTVIFVGARAASAAK